MKRFIPTYVGYTLSVFGLDRISTSSSPHTWGIPTAAVCGVAMVRFIPTYVGYTFSVLQARGEKLVHPHIRGVYFPQGVDDLLRHGSSPHTWGIHEVAREIDRYMAVHPHIRGVYGFRRHQP